MSKKLTKVELEKLVKELNATIKNSDIENRQLIEKNTRLSKENDGLKEINNKLVAENKDMKKQLKDKDIEREIFMAARAEAKEKANNAEVIIETFKAKERSLLDISKQREEELHGFYKKEIMKLQSTLTEQNETLATLFEMMDNSMQQQQFLYSKYRGVFVKEQELFKERGE